MFEAANLLVDLVQIIKKFILKTGVNSTASSAISTTEPVTFLTSAGAESRTLANGREGQLKAIVAKATLTGTVTVTPANLANGTNLVFDAAGDGWLGIFHAGEWHTIAINAITIS